MQVYRPRIVDKILKRKLEGKGAVIIQGPKWCGKTTTAEQTAKSILYMSKPEDVKSNLLTADISPSILRNGETPRLIDEWQIAPRLWDAVRFEVDHRPGFGHFLLVAYKGYTVRRRIDFYYSVWVQAVYSPIESFSNYRTTIYADLSEGLLNSKKLAEPCHFQD